MSNSMSRNPEETFRIQELRSRIQCSISMRTEVLDRAEELLNQAELHGTEIEELEKELSILEEK